MADPAILASLPDVSPPTSLIAAMTIAVVVLTGVIGYLFRHYTAKMAEINAGFNERLSQMTSKHAEEHKAWAAEREGWCAERASWAAERAKLEQHRTEYRLEYETRHREVVAHYADQVSELYEKTLEHESAARREYADNMEHVADKAAEATAKLGVVIEKVYDAFAGLRRSTQ
jgi:Skp family chaperone for outer membrane proteins